MPVISRITTQKKNNQRYNIFLQEGKNERFAFSVDESILVEYRLRKGLEISDSVIEAIQKKDETYKFYIQAINFLSYRMRSRKEVFTYLKKKEASFEQIEQVLERLEKEKLIDDEQFARMFVQSRINTTSKGPMLIKKELLEKGISSAIAERALDQYTEELQYKKITAFFEKKKKSRKKVSYRKQLDQWKTNLLQKGFPMDMIQQAAADLDENMDEEKEWEALVYQGEKLKRKHEGKLSGYALRNKVKEGLCRKGFPMDMIQQFTDKMDDEY